MFAVNLLKLYLLIQKVTTLAQMTSHTTM